MPGGRIKCSFTFDVKSSTLSDLHNSYTHIGEGDSWSCYYLVEAVVNKKKIRLSNPLRLKRLHHYNTFEIL